MSSTKKTRPFKATGSILVKTTGSILAALVFTSALAVDARAEPINIFGLSHTPLGNATLSVVNGSLAVSNIGSTGVDGVSVALPSNATSWEAFLSDLGTASDTSVGSFLQLTGFATVGGVLNHTVQSIRVTDVGGEPRLRHT
jgi:hypothetical protein